MVKKAQGKSQSSAKKGSSHKKTAKVSARPLAKASQHSAKRTGLKSTSSARSSSVRSAKSAKRSSAKMTTSRASSARAKSSARSSLPRVASRKKVSTNSARHSANKAITFDTLFIKTLRSLYDAEQQLLKIFPEMIRSAQSPELKHAIQSHAEETKEQVKRLEQIFKSLKVPASGETSEAMKGLLQEAREALRMHPSSLRDAAMIAAIQCIELYEVAGYGTARTFARHVDNDEAASLLKKTLDEEAQADKALTSIAEGGIFTSGVNQEALAGSNHKRR